jgi:phosphate transport system substrate-binding protein
MKRTGLLGVLCVAVVLASGCGRSTPEQPLNAGGSSFVNPLMQKWALMYQKDTPVAVKYKSIGSGMGIELMTNKTLDFGCSDAPMTDDELKKARAVGGEVLHIPLVIGAVVPAYNLPGIQHQVRFTGPLLADIFLGKITKWNDPRLQEIQEAVVTLPDKDIQVVHRVDGSGTTYVLTEYLSKVSPEWKKAKFGFATTVKFPTGIARPGNEGVTEEIHRLPGALGYIELTYAIQSEVQFGTVQNRAGSFISPGYFSINKAVESALTEIPEDLRYSLTDAPGELSYPITGSVFALVYESPPHNGKYIVEFLRWATHEGQKYAEELDYGPLPSSLVERVEQKLKRIRVN